MSTTGYARVSNAEQDPVERASGATMDRPEWQACNRGLGAGDTLTVVRIDRLGRSLADLVSTLDDLAARGVHFRSLTEGIDTSTPLGRMFYQLAAAFAEYERALIRERTCAGIGAAGTHGRTTRTGTPTASSGRRCSRNCPTARGIPIDN